MAVHASYDPEADALYLRISRHSVGAAMQFDDGTFADLDVAGHLAGIEVVSPRRDWPLEAILDRCGCDPQDAEWLRRRWPDKYRPATIT